MSRKLILPQPPDQYNVDLERIRNREIETVIRVLTQKLSELEERIKALEP